MKDLIEIQNQNGKLVVSSRVIAENLNKRHSDVLESLDSISENRDFRSLIIPSSYKVDGQKKKLQRIFIN